MPHITIKCARTWHWTRMRRQVGQSSDLVASSPFPYWAGCTTNTSGYDFRKGQVDAHFFFTPPPTPTGTSSGSNRPVDHLHRLLNGSRQPLNTESIQRRYEVMEIPVRLMK